MCVSTYVEIYIYTVRSFLIVLISNCPHLHLSGTSRPRTNGCNKNFRKCPTAQGRTGPHSLRTASAQSHSGHNLQQQIILKPDPHRAAQGRTTIKRSHVAEGMAIREVAFLPLRTRPQWVTGY